MKQFYPHRLHFLPFVLLGVFLVPFLADAQTGFPYCEPLSEGHVPENTIFGGDAQFVADAGGAGVLQLTSNQRQQSGYLYVDIPFPSSYGLKASFEYFSYGGNGNADGIVCFLFDAEVPVFRPGGFGGALGYAFNTAHQAPGLSGAYIGIGLDEYGNFTNAIEGKDGPGFRPNNISIRGPGEGFEGYQFIHGVRTDQAGGGLAEGDQFSLSSGGLGTSRVTDSNQAGYRKVFLDLRPVEGGVGMVLNLDMLVTTVDNEPRMVSIFKDFPYEHRAPDNLKIGFAATTGESTNFHEIRNIVVEVSDDKNLRLPELRPKKDLACAGETAHFEITEEDVFLPNENSVIRCVQLYKTEEEIFNEEEVDPCSFEQCSPDHQRLEIEEGVFIVDAAGGTVAFEPSSDFQEGEVTIYYTVTDNYGQTSLPEQWTIGVFDYPEAPVIMEEDGGLPVFSFRLCEEEKIVLEAVSSPSLSYKWYRNGGELDGEVASTLSVSEPGVYTAWVFNEANCSTSSQEVVVDYPAPPSSKMEERTVSCGADFVDFTLLIEGFDDHLYDYQVVAPDGSTLSANALTQIQQPGFYQIRAKHKDLTCWSEPSTTELIMVRDPVEADFSYAVLMADGGQEVIDIFVNDELQFKDASLENPVAWEWDFGDGSQSNERHPRYAYTNEGNYLVSLTVYDEMGYCSSVHTQEVNVTRSYRIMYPTAFTPLGPENRFFKPKTKGVKSMRLSIFNSWGDLIYMSEDIHDQGWDGRNNGRIQPAGNYAFKVEVTTVLGEMVTDSGRFTLIR